MRLISRLAELRETGGRAVLFTVVEGDGVGGKALVVEGGETLGDGVPAGALAQFDELVRGGRNRLVEVDGARVFTEWYGPPPRLLVYGAVDTAEALCRGAKLLGWTAIVADARATFLTPERMPTADRPDRRSGRRRRSPRSPRITRPRSSSSRTTTSSTSRR